LIKSGPIGSLLLYNHSFFFFKNAKQQDDYLKFSICLSMNENANNTIVKNLKMWYNKYKYPSNMKKEGGILWLLK